MTPRTLPVINAIGCLVLTGVMVLQWRKERALDASMHGLRTELAAARVKADEEAKRRAALERDIEVLKDSIASTQQAAESVTRNLVEKDQAAAQLQTELNAAREQLTLWEAALKARDERIVSLDANLAATRKRLDEAVAKLKSAGAR
jgi:chromosome segregation ATPase